MNWLLITFVAYFLNAIAMVIDKTLLKKEIENPFVYTFYIAVLGGILMIFIIPFGIQWPGMNQFFISLLAGGIFSIGLFLMFWGLKKEDASRLAPMIGGLTPIFVFILAHFFLNEILRSKEFFAFSLIIIGTFLISLDFREYGAWSWIKRKLRLNKAINLPKIRRTLLLSLPAALFFGISYVLTKDVYNHQPFLSGFIWTRFGALIVAVLPMLWLKNRHDLANQQRNKNTSRVKYRFFFGQACGGASAILIQYAMFLASVSLVQALQGVQYVFIFLIVLFLTYNYPKILLEKTSKQIIFQKSIAIILIGIGISLIV